MNTDGLIGSADDEHKHATTDKMKHSSMGVQSCLPPGHLQDTNTRLQPLRKKKLENILKLAVASYDTFDDDRKYAVCKLALKLQEVVTSNKASKTRAETKTGTFVGVPSTTEIKKEPRKRLMPSAERESRKKSHALHARMVPALAATNTVGHAHDRHSGFMTLTMNGQLCVSKVNSRA